MNESKEDKSTVEQTLMGAKNSTPYAYGMFSAKHLVNSKDGIVSFSIDNEEGKSNIWKELLYFTQGRCKSFAISEYIVAKK